jgi:hypothetical protein
LSDLGLAAGHTQAAINAIRDDAGFSIGCRGPGQLRGLSAGDTAERHRRRRSSIALNQRRNLGRDAPEPLAFGVDNVFNEKYHLFHPFPQRTFVVSGKVQF